MKVKLAREAEADLEAISDWIAKDNPLRALSFARELRQRCVGLGHRPNRFPVFATLKDILVRKRSCRKYAIFYVVGLDRIDAIRILHAAQDSRDALGIEN